jgi:acetyl-CoA carboxylase carboxyl transferase subunit alpha
LTAQDLIKLGVIDAVVPEPLGGAHRDYDAAATSLRQELSRHLAELAPLSPQELVAQRVEKFARMGMVME